MNCIPLLLRSVEVEMAGKTNWYPHKCFYFIFGRREEHLASSCHQNAKTQPCLFSLEDALVCEFFILCLFLLFLIQYVYSGHFQLDIMDSNSKEKEATLKEIWKYDLPHKLTEGWYNLKWRDL